MKNVTVSLDEDTARWARIEAAKRDQSVSSMLREVLQREMGAQDTYAAAQARYLSRDVTLRTNGQLPSREEVHDRAGLR